MIYKCYIEVLSPLNLGCDEFYEPTSFILNEKNKEIIVFSTSEMMNFLSKEEIKRFSDICMKGTIESIIEIYKFMKRQDIPGRPVKVSSAFIDHYNKIMNLPLNDKNRLLKELNRFTISRTSFLNQDQRPYIPGSAIKGALRTAYLNYLASNRKIPTPKGKNAAKTLERQLLHGSFSTDPFRMVKVSDFMPVGKIQTRILYAINQKKKPSKFSASGPYQILEVIQPGNIFIGEIRIDSPREKTNIKNPIKLKSLLQACRDFFESEKLREDNELSRIGIPPLLIKHNNHGALLRIGQHSGAECVTIEGHRRIVIRQGNKSYVSEHATTLWLASEEQKPKDKKRLLPFGWIITLPLDERRLDNFKNKEAEWQKFKKSILEKRQQRINNLILQKQKREEENKALEIKRKKEKREAERRKAEFEAMTPEERDIAYINDPVAIENKVIEIYNRIDSFSIENKKKLALALKEYWIKHNKWDKKNCSEKQWRKVQKIKNILNE